MTQEELDEKEFEEWFGLTYRLDTKSEHAICVLRSDLNYLGMKESWLAGRRTLRERRGNATKSIYSRRD